MGNVDHLRFTVYVAIFDQIEPLALKHIDYTKYAYNVCINMQIGSIFTNHPYTPHPASALTEFSYTWEWIN